MKEPKTLDVRGLSCPEPAMLTREALIAIGSGTLVVISDSFTSSITPPHPGPNLLPLQRQ